MAASEWSIERVSKIHDRDGFNCGNALLDEFLRQFARQNDAKGISRTYVVVRDGETAVKGFYTVRNGHVGFRNLPEAERRKLPRYPVPVVHIARLAVCTDAQGCGLGARLLVNALQLALAVSEKIGVYAVEVVAKDGHARRFYEKYGFRGLPEDDLHLYLSMKVLRQLLRR